jgi:hypothetical protein
MGLVKNFLPCLAISAAVLLTGGSYCLAQQAQPSVGYIYPAGTRQGATTQAIVGGQFIRSAQAVHISGDGVQAKITDIPQPLNQLQVNDLRDKLRELRLARQSQPTTQSSRPASRAATATAATTSSPASTGPATRPTSSATTASAPTSAPAGVDEIAWITEQLAQFDRGRDVPSLAETVKIEIVVDASAQPGRRELRLIGPNGLSNPLVFCVGSLPERVEPITKASRIVAVTTGQNLPRIADRLAGSANQDAAIALPVVLNGQITPGDIDKYTFTARSGQHIVLALAGRELIPYLADAVPGWFDAVITIYDAKGNQQACTDHYLFSPDPAMRFDVPADGTYILEIRDILYRGREDFVYRLTVGELPFITGIFPMGGLATTQTSVAMKGWDLPAGTMTIKPPTSMPAIMPVRAISQESFAGMVFFATDTLPECLECQPDKKIGGAQQIELPIIINGRIDKPGQWDVYSFQGSAGLAIVAEVMARRLGSPLDSVIKLTDASGKTLAMNDDFADKSTGLVTHQADSFLLTTLPADGEYRLAIADIQGNAGDLYAYRLRIGPPREDFDLLVAPSAINMRGGETIPLTVHAIRHDGFAGPIELSLKNAPAGFSLSGARVPAGADQIRLTLTAPARNIAGLTTINIAGLATIAGLPVVRQAHGADDRMEAFGNRHLVPALGPQVCMIGRPMGRGAGTIKSPMPVSIPVGGTTAVEFTIPQRPAGSDIILELSDPPPGISVQKVQSAGNRTEMILAADAKAIKAGMEGNLIINVSLQPASMPSSSPDKPKAGRKIVLGTLPAIAFKVVNP